MVGWRTVEQRNFRVADQPHLAAKSPFTPHGDDRQL
jgi:hypothetical protein